MSNPRTHHVTTTDGVTLGGTVHGHGPPLVFVQGIMGDGDLDWGALMPHLSDRFTCHLPSYRGRGLSGDHPDVRYGRLVDDVLTYVDSVEAPTGLVGWSAGADLALVAAGTQPGAVDAVAPVEPVMPRLMGTGEQAALGGGVARTGELAAEGRLADAMRAFAELVFNDEDIAVAEDAGYLEAAGRYVPHLLELLHQWRDAGGPTPDDPAVLGEISAPVLVLVGSDTRPYAAAAARHVVDHAPRARVHAIPGAGHASPLTHPRALADALTEFFARVQDGPDVARARDLPTGTMR